MIQDINFGKLPVGQTFKKYNPYGELRRDIFVKIKPTTIGKVGERIYNAVIFAPNLLPNAYQFSDEMNIQTDIVE